MNWGGMPCENMYQNGKSKHQKKQFNYYLTQIDQNANDIIADLKKTLLNKKGEF